jgi:AraC-like DNA-binding protein
MTNQYSFLKGQPIFFAEGYPFEFKGKMLPGSKPWFAQDSWGQIVTQEIRRLNYYIRFNIICLSSIKGIKTSFSARGLTTTTSLENNFRLTIAGAGRIHVEAGQFASLYGKAINNFIYTEKNKTCISLDCSWSDDCLVNFLPADNELLKLLKAPVSIVPVLIGEPYRQLTRTLRLLIDDLFYSPYVESLQEEALEAIMEEYLFQVMQSSADKNWITDYIKPGELQKVLTAIEIIKSNMGRHLHHVEIARQVGLNPCTLKLRFKQVTGKNMFEYLQHIRCCIARDGIISTNLPIKAFSSSAGYRDFANFVEGFKRHMGVYPSELRH